MARSELQCAGMSALETHDKIIGKASMMIDYANEAMRGVRVVTAKYASI